MGKKIKKVAKKVTGTLRKVADPAGVFGSDEPKAKEVAPEAAPAPAPAANIEAPKEDANESDGADSEAARKAARSRGKRGLSVARSSGTGLNI